MAVLLPLALGVLCLFVWLRKVGSREAGLPPGPPTVPLLGNLHIFPTEFAHNKCMLPQRGLSLKVGPGTAVVLTNLAAIKELMENRSSSTGNRPPTDVADIITGGLNMVWPLHVMGFHTHIRRYANSVILSVLYGKCSPRYETPETTAFFRANHEWELVLEPGAIPPVDWIPLLKYVPERWAKWKRDCAKARKLQRDLYFGLLDETKERLSRGDENGSYMEEILMRQEELGMDREMTGFDFLLEFLVNQSSAKPGPDT
ncbi:hypothetical protein K438DRAFT_1770568 [Mycena galopus ATCC 62051]|nr:hypothetical protein K438DRAFT_1770568 [Mycena galopus ATCC 62051]